MQLLSEMRSLKVEYYFRSYGGGSKGGPSLERVAEQFRKIFHRTTPSNTVMLSIVTKFRRSGSVLYQPNGRFGRPVTVTTNENRGRVLQSPRQNLRRTSIPIPFPRSYTT